MQDTSILNVDTIADSYGVAQISENEQVRSALLKFLTAGFKSMKMNGVLVYPVSYTHLKASIVFFTST